MSKGATRKPMTNEALARRLQRMDQASKENRGLAMGYARDTYEAVRSLLEEVKAMRQEQRRMAEALNRMADRSDRANEFTVMTYWKTMEAVTHAITASKRLNILRDHLITDFFPKGGDVLVVKEQHLREYPVGAHVKVKHCDTNGYVCDERGSTFHKSKLRYMTAMETSIYNTKANEPT